MRSRSPLKPCPYGEGQGWGQYLIRYQDITDPTPPKGHPPRKGRVQEGSG